MKIHFLGQKTCKMIASNQTAIIIHHHAPKPDTSKFYVAVQELALEKTKSSSAVCRK